MRNLLLLTCIALTACAAPRWVNTRNAAADLEADTADCYVEAERVMRIQQLTDPHAAGCISGPNCTTNAENRRIKASAEALAAQKRCLAGRGWQQQG